MRVTAFFVNNICQSNIDGVAMRINLISDIEDGGEEGAGGAEDEPEEGRGGQGAPVQELAGGRC